MAILLTVMTACTVHWGVIVYKCLCVFVSGPVGRVVPVNGVATHEWVFKSTVNAHLQFC